MKVTFTIKDKAVTLVEYRFDDNEKTTGLEGKKIIKTYLKENL